MRLHATFAIIVGLALPLAAMAAPASPARMPALFPGVPTELRNYFLDARDADNISDGLQRCLAYPDMPGNKWPANLARSYCDVIQGEKITFAQIRTLIEAGKHVELEQLFQVQLDRHFSGEHSEHIHSIFDGFNIVNKEVDELSLRWLALAPKSPFANNARAQFIGHSAWAARGGKFMKDTPRENIERMAVLAPQAIALAGTALRLEPKLLSAYEVIIGMEMLNGGDVLSEAAYQRAIAIDPACRNITRIKMRTFRPRWGGSDEEMDAYARELAPLVKSRPLIAMTMILADDEKADDFDSADMHDAAIAVRIPAAKKAPQVEMVNKLGMRLARNDLGKNQPALMYLLTGYRFGFAEFRELREMARILMEFGDHDWARKVLFRAQALKPEDGWVFSYLGQTYFHQKRFEEAAPLLQKAIDGGESRAGALYMQSLNYLMDGQPGKAANYAKLYTTENPKDANGWQLYANLQQKLGNQEGLRAALTSMLTTIDRSNKEHAEIIADAESYLANPKTPAKAR